MIKLFAKSQLLRNDEIISLKRTGVVTYVDGKPHDYQEEWFTVKGTVQPMSGRDLEMMPEHDRFKEQYWLYIQNTKFAVDKGFNVESNPPVKINDIVVRLGVNYQVQSVQDWGSFIRCHMMRIDVGRYATPGGQNSA